ncbi:Zinc finger DNA binding protein [Operophtera brumata]|uniref:Zinc finger DNA binding protein n=1 Tax=Operophtera brumata TaxID=104452 RepID=A0A0L7LAQ2_OPEBR|nr:Zinc finger DNA binding protein [Operophtera brumata]
MSHTARPQPEVVSPVGYKTPLQHYNSEPSLLDTPRKDHDSWGGQRKCKRDELSRADILDLFEAFTTQQDTKFEAILASLGEVKTSIDVMSKKYDEALLRLNCLEVEKREQDIRVQLLENKIDFLERQARGTSIELRNIPQEPKESKKDLINLVIKTAEKLNTKLDSSEIKDAYRIGSNQNNKLIITEFTTTFAREGLINSFKTYNKEHPTEKFSTSSLGIGGTSKPVYLSESLTQKDRRLYFLAREFAKGNGYVFCWTSLGRIFVRRTEGSPRIRITCETDIENLKF